MPTLVLKPSSLAPADLALDRIEVSSLPWALKFVDGSIVIACMIPADRAETIPLVLDQIEVLMCREL